MGSHTPEHNLSIFVSYFVENLRCAIQVFNNFMGSRGRSHHHAPCSYLAEHAQPYALNASCSLSADLSCSLDCD